MVPVFLLLSWILQCKHAASGRIQTNYWALFTQGRDYGKSSSICMVVRCNGSPMFYEKRNYRLQYCSFILIITIPTKVKKKSLKKYMTVFIENGILWTWECNTSCNQIVLDRWAGLIKRLIPCLVINRLKCFRSVLYVLRCTTVPTWKNYETFFINGFIFSQGRSLTLIKCKFFLSLTTINCADLGDSNQGRFSSDPESSSVLYEGGPADVKQILCYTKSVT